MRVAQLVGFLVFYYYSLMEKKSKAVMLTLEQQASSVFDHYCYQDEETEKAEKKVDVGDL